jgi:hypothetical protein
MSTKDDIAPVARRTIERSIKDYNARQLMAMAMLKTGMPREEIMSQTSLSAAQYNKCYDQYQESGFDKLTSQIMDNWEHVLRAKMMNVTEKALDTVFDALDAGETKSAKEASSVFNDVFGNFRLSTGKSTENVASTTLRITEMIESKTALRKPNQSQYHDNIVDLKTKIPSTSEVM